MATSSSKAVFKAGDIVRHKASCERGVIACTNFARRCKMHPLMSGKHFMGASKDCEWVEEFDGTYDVSVGIEKMVEGVPEGLLVLDKET